MAYNENVQLEFSLDQKETYLASWLNKKAEEYTNLFRYKREALILAWKYGIESNVFDKEKYKKLLEDRGIVYATEYKKYFQLKKEILRIKEFLGFTKELWDENVVIDEDLKKEDDDEIQNPADTEVKAKVESDESTADNNTEDDIETLRQKYFEKFGKQVATGYKNNIEWIKKKLL
jgi:Ni,Fe-hydrogenase I large subunit